MGTWKLRERHGWGWSAEAPSLHRGTLNGAPRAALEAYVVAQNAGAGDDGALQAFRAEGGYWQNEEPR